MDDYENYAKEESPSEGTDPAPVIYVEVSDDDFNRDEKHQKYTGSNYIRGAHRKSIGL